MVWKLHRRLAWPQGSGDCIGMRARSEEMRGARRSLIYKVAEHPDDDRASPWGCAHDPTRCSSIGRQTEELAVFCDCRSAVAKPRNSYTRALPWFDFGAPKQGHDSMTKLASVRVLLDCDDDESAIETVQRHLQSSGDPLLGSRIDAVVDYEVPADFKAVDFLGLPEDNKTGSEPVHIEVRDGHLRIASPNHCVMDFGPGHFAAHLDDAATVARCLNAHHTLVAAVRDAMHYVALRDSGEKTPLTSAELMKRLANALTVARTPALMEKIAKPAPSNGAVPA